MEIHPLLYRRQIDDTVLPHVVGIVLAHRLAGPLNDAGDPGLADEHMVGFLRQHEAAGPRQRVETGFGQRRQLILAVAVLEIGEHEEGEPIVGALVEGLQDARLVGVAGMTFQHHIRFLAPIAAEIGLQKIDHRPQVTAFLDIDLKQIA